MKQQLIERLIKRFPELATPRLEASNKGSYGTLAVVGGSEGMSGSICLAASAALLLGCGKSFAVFTQDALPMPLLASYPEVMLKTAAHLAEIKPLTAIVCGCGLNTSEASIAYLKSVIKLINDNPVPVLFDADALNIISGHPEIAKAVSQLPSPVVITPHPGEASRLLKKSVRDIQADRKAAANALSRILNAWVVLKGHRSLIASPTGELYENDSGNAGLASAGSGDTLSGIIGSLLAQKQPIEVAVRGGVWLHGAASEWIGEGIALPGLLAGELAPAIREMRKQALLSRQENPDSFLC